MNNNFDLEMFKIYLRKIADNPSQIPLPDSDYIISEVDKTSHVGSYLKGYTDGAISGERILINILLDYLDS